MTTIDTLTDDQIDTLRTEAGTAGDLAMVRICDRALTGDDDARAECVRAIRDAEAMVKEAPAVSSYAFRTDAGDEEPILASSLEEAAEIASRRITRAQWEDGAWGLVYDADGVPMDVPARYPVRGEGD